MREMDDHFGDVYGIISDREIEISHELAQYVLQYEELLTTCSDVCGELDRCVLHRGIYSHLMCTIQFVGFGPGSKDI
jgi:DNA mismatch repair protein MSH5